MVLVLVVSQHVLAEEEKSIINHPWNYRRHRGNRTETWIAGHVLGGRVGIVMTDRNWEILWWGEKRDAILRDS